MPCKRTPPGGVQPPKAQQDIGAAAASEGAAGVGTNTTIIDASREPSQSNCMLCDANDSVDAMVQCDDCERWYHQSCVNVSPSITDEHWQCPECQRRSSKSPDDSREDKIDQKLEQLREQEERLDAKQKTIEKLLQKLALHAQKVTTSDVPVSDRPKPTVVTTYTGTVPKATRTTSRLELDNPYEFPSITEPLPASRSLGHSVSLSSNLYTTATRQAPIIHTKANESFMSAQAQNQTAHYRSSRQHSYDHNFQEADNSMWDSSRIFDQSVRQPAPTLGGTSGPAFFPPPTSSVATSVQNQHVVQPQSSNLELLFANLMTRQVASNDLPKFSGRTEEWIPFIRSYEEANRLCNFTEGENLLRLRKALDGEALSAVDTQLNFNESAEDVINELKWLYGRPKDVIENLRRQIEALEPFSEQKLQLIVDLSRLIKNIVAVIRTSNLDQYLSDVSLVATIHSKLPVKFQLSWAGYQRRHPDRVRRNGELVCIAEVINEAAMDAYEVLRRTQPKAKPNIRPRKSHLNVHEAQEVNVHEEDAAIKTPATTTPVTVSTATKVPATTASEAKPKIRVCYACQSVDCKDLAKCPKYVAKTIADRWELVKASKLCRICLRKHFRGCKAKKVCTYDKCERYHHPTLHSEDTSKASLTVAANNYQLQEQGKVMFRILPVYLHHGQKRLKVYAFLDEGSSISLMNENVAQALGISGKSSKLHLKWTGGASRMEDSLQISLAVSSTFPGASSHQIVVHTVSALQLPEQSLDYDKLKSSHQHLDHLPIESHTQAAPQILLGMDCQRLIVPRKIRNSDNDDDDLIATSCVLGWTVSGNSKNKNPIPISATHFLNAHICECQKKSDARLDEQLRQYFRLDSIGLSKNASSLYTLEEKEAIKLMEAETTKRGDRYETGLLLRSTTAKVPNSWNMALHRWNCLKSRFKKDAQLKSTCNQQINKYLSKGYIKKLTPAELKSWKGNVWYLPVFPVVNKNKPGKTRLVWDAAAVVGDVSLNSMLYTGPDLTASLVDVLLRFRERRYVINGDIEEMFHRISIKPEHQNLQRFLWYDVDDPEKVAIYAMTVVIFGATCSPFQAQYVKNLNASQYRHDHPAAYEAIEKGHYVDDLLISVDTEKAAVDIAKQIKRIHATANFNIRNWHSNSKEVLTAMGELQNSDAINVLANDSDTVEKVLGMWWVIDDDVITFSLRLNQSYNKLIASGNCPTKRQLLSVLMAVYDPLGLLSQFMVGLKSIVQEVQRSTIGWDERVR